MSNQISSCKSTLKQVNLNFDDDHDKDNERYMNVSHFANDTVMNTVIHNGFQHQAKNLK